MVLQKYLTNVIQKYKIKNRNLNLPSVNKHRDLQGVFYLIEKPKIQVLD